MTLVKTHFSPVTASAGYVAGSGGDEGKTYDAKAILGAVRGFQFPKRGTLSGAEFRGGDTVAAVLQTMGFDVRQPKTRSRAATS